MSDYINALEELALFEHWARSPHDTAHNWGMAFGQHAKFLEKVSSHIVAQLVETRTEYLTRIQSCVVADVSEYSVLGCWWQRIAKEAPAISVILWPWALPRGIESTLPASTRRRLTAFREPAELPG